MRSIGASNPLVTAMAIYCLALPASARVPEPEEHGFVEQIEIARVDVPILVLDSDGQPISRTRIDEIGQFEGASTARGFAVTDATGNAERCCSRSAHTR
ncbi:MAG: hypothetical protein U0V87_18060 [Acidobacteriota bacterium]